MALQPRCIWLRGHYKSFNCYLERLKILNFACALPKIYCEFAFVFAIRREILKVEMLLIRKQKVLKGPIIFMIKKKT
jgi:hypothetical protein